VTELKTNRPGFLYEISWETCSPGGGIHTVLSTSSEHLRAVYGDDLLYVGPDRWANRPGQATFLPDPVQPPVAALAAERDVPARFGRWNVDGRPRAALIDYGRLLEQKNRILGDLWTKFEVDSIHADWDTVERILFGYAAGVLVELHYHTTVRPRPCRAVAHVHNWQAAGAILRLHSTAPDLGTVYTPHGTALGRELSEAGLQLAPEADVVEIAKERRLEPIATLEIAAAKAAGALTVVDHAQEAEALRMMGRRPDLVTPNGFTPPPAPDPSVVETVRQRVRQAAERFLGAPLDDETRIVFSSGRYEFRNKGYATTLHALGRLQKASPSRDLVLLVFSPAGQTGLRPEVRQRLERDELAGEPIGIATHNLKHAEDDPILRACREASIENRPDDPVKVIFVPLLLDGADPVFPYTYEDVLRAADLALFPSLYEPWGYTPLEALAAGVPAFTTDATGFGRFLLPLPPEERPAVTVLPAGDEEALADQLARFLERSDEELATQREQAPALARRTPWGDRIGATIDAHALAATRAADLSAAAPELEPRSVSYSRRALVQVPPTAEEQPRLRRFTVTTVLPERLARLDDVARNIWWSWTPRAVALFERLDPAFPGASGNPVNLLRELPAARLAEAAADDAFLAHYDEVVAGLEAYLGRAPADVPETAYFCAEFAVHESLPIYSGGLGVLAGDHLKSASDTSLPFTGIGLRYRSGYFVQHIRPDGSQGVEFRAVDPAETPMRRVVDADGEPLLVSIDMPGRTLQAAAWRVDVGRVPLYLLDTRVAANEASDQGITERLYPSEREPRLCQEILLGVGGWRLLQALDAGPRVCHLNEGHSAFLLLERLLELVENHGLTFEEAAVVVRGSSVFTTHTPVPAGHDRFSEGLMRRYFGHVAERLGLDWQEFFDLGRATREDTEFSMTVLALKLSGRANGVSRLHGEVSRRMNAAVWPAFHETETPISSITNGVHLPTWCGPETGELIDEELGADWRTSRPDPEEWVRLGAVADERLWAVRRAQKRRLCAYLRRHLDETGQSWTGPDLDEDALWIGYARRFAPYKRATLLFHDAARIERILQDEDRPVRIVYAGKSHPDDHEGAALVKEIVELTRDPRFAGRVFFVEDYGMTAGRMLTQGVDVWLNTPTRPLEASGTSGMKACLNGSLHASILDGWWCEGYDGENGFTFGDAREVPNPEILRAQDARSLYAMLETELVPLFFERDADGRPQGWLELVRRCLATIPAVFDTDRMVTEYAGFAYRPLGKRGKALQANGFRKARARVERYAALREAWKSVKVEDIQATDLSEGGLGRNESFEVRARVHHEGVDRDDLRVELFVSPAEPVDDETEPTRIPLEPDETGEYWSGAYDPPGSGTYLWGVRAYPALDDDTEVAHLGLVSWA